jgi:hypothetical protein
MIVKPISQADDDAAHAFVTHKNVRPSAQQEIRRVFLGKRAQQSLELGD